MPKFCRSPKSIITRTAIHPPQSAIYEMMSSAIQASDKSQRRLVSWVDVSASSAVDIGWKYLIRFDSASYVGSCMKVRILHAQAVHNLMNVIPN